MDLAKIPNSGVSCTKERESLRPRGTGFPLSGFAVLIRDSTEDMIDSDLSS